MKIWIDFDNTPHVNVLLPIIEELKHNHDFIFSAREVFETLPLLKYYGIEPIVSGVYKGKNRIKKVSGLVSRLISLAFNIPQFDISISLGGNYTATISKLRSKPSIIFSDNDISFKLPAYKFGSHFIFPYFFNTSNLSNKYGIKNSQIYKFSGFKEDIYIADYIPDPFFFNSMPFDNFITIRPENLKASYIPSNSKTIIPKLFEKFKNENILFLPRYQEEKEYAKGFTNIFIPNKPLPGLDVCYYTKAMLTGAGTFAREAALLGKPSVSFFPGHTFLSVDNYMINKGWILKSRNVDEIYDFVINSKSRKMDTTRSKIVKKEVINILQNILSKYSE